MRRRTLLCRMACWGIGSGAVAFTGCGSILYSERIHRPHSRDLDWKVAALNGLGLTLFFVPGVIAFVVDFYTGAIYLPPTASHHHASTPPSTEAASDGTTGEFATKENPPSSSELRRIGTLTPDHAADTPFRAAELEQVVAEELGQSVSLLDSNARVSELAAISDYRQQCRRHQRDPSFGTASGDFFRKMLLG
ncbi:hypothetical protein FYK55_16265 [Roseiconus nitratireducens]|uniref:Transmembrane protein n=1 Tax=Roseiconus nitratireducens TaxID=2605748 RepID=A0A5M6D2N2_9BACT|nr:hypothetical protein [Roseiconus nitratireducens]KAA5541767.1 hypothetical protein FYK55_16265 [Roseiconus nitratireducens]